nr:zinc finger, CCHC-type [Tanacetum cinerariifolium]
MAAAAMKHMATNFAKLEKFEGVDFRRWQKRMHFLLSSMSVVYVLTTPISENVKNATVEQLRKRDKWDNDDYVCKGLILNGMSDPLFGNKKYFVIFIDDALRFCYVYLLHTKNEALDKFKEFKTEVELQQGSLIKRFSFNREGEYMDTLYFQSVGITHETNAPYTPQQNVPRPNLRIPNETKDFSGSMVPEEVATQQPRPELRKSKRNRIPKNFGPKFQLYLIERTRVEVSDQHSYCFNVEDDPKTFDEAMKSQDVAFWTKAINDEMDSIMGNNTWVLVDLPLGCKPLGCKYIFKRKLKVNGTTENFKARLVIQGFRLQSGIDYFDTYTPVARINTIRLLIVVASIHNLIIHQMDVKTAFLNGELEEEVYMNQPQGFIMPENENKVCKLIKSICRLKQAPKQWHQKFDEVNLPKEFLSSKFSMKYIGEADVILGIRIKHESNKLVIYKSHYTKKALKKFNYFDCTLMSTLVDTSKKLMPNNGHAVSQLEYSRVIGCLMYSALASNSAGTEVLEKSMDYSLTYSGYLSVLEGCTDASWIDNTEDKSSTSGCVFLLGRGAIYYAFKKQTFINGSTIKSEFVALAAADKEAEWLRNLILEIPL